jgi:hypothetical protein
MEKKFAITTLTCNNRATLIPTIRSLMVNTVLPPTRWFILLQGCTSNHVENVKQLCEEYERAYPQLQFDLIISEKNLGLSKGNNILIKYSQDYDYIMNIEDDWICLPESITSLNGNWLLTCLQFLESRPNVSTLFLRRYVDAADKEKSAWTRDVYYYGHKYRDNFNASRKMKGPPESHTVHLNEVKFQEIPKFTFTFNPCIRRHLDYVNKGVYPLDEFSDIRKAPQAVKDGQSVQWKMTQYGDVPQWGSCESIAMEKTRDLITYNVGSGKFGHAEDFYPVLEQQGIRY